MPELDPLLDDANNQSRRQEVHHQPVQPHEPDVATSNHQRSHSSIAAAVELQLATQLSSDVNHSHGLSMLDENGEGEDVDEAPNHEPAVSQFKHNGEHVAHGLPIDKHEGHRISQLDHREQPRQSGLQYLPPDDHAEFSTVQQRQFEQQLQQAFIPTSDSSEHLTSPQHQQHHSQPASQLRPPPAPLQPHALPDHITQQYAVSAQEDIPPRKRSKVSRACDECRRKKVKCDAPSETGEEPCSNCRRCSMRCLFSRIPQKRGPSKGYIKELADRIHHIEGKLASEGGNLESLTELLGGGRRESLDIFTSNSQSDENSRKRPYSSISAADIDTPVSSRPEQWNSEPRPNQPYQTNVSQGEMYSAKRLAPHPLSRPAEETPSRADPTEARSDGSEYSETSREVNGEAFDVYLNVVHQCFPFLAKTKSRVQDQLANCPPLLRTAFVETLHGTMQSFVSAPGLYTHGDVGSATRLVAGWESDPTPRSLVTNLVHLQMLVLMVIGTDNHGPSSLKGEHGGPSKSSVLGRAVGLAYSMRLHLGTLESNNDSQSNADSDGNIAVRAWWVLVMLDRWNAVSTASPLFIPNDSVVLLPQLNSLLGENVYHLTRLSNILGHFAPVSVGPPRALSSDSAARPILNSFFNLAIELFREVLPTNISPSTHPTLHLVYWHSRLLSYLFQSNSKSADVLWACKESANLLVANPQLLTPLNHHFFCLTALSLLELAKVEDSRERALPLLKDLSDLNLAPSTWDGVIRDRIAGQTRASPSRQNLQQLASIASLPKGDPDTPDHVSTLAPLRTSTDYADLGFDPRDIIHGGYLNILTRNH